MSKKTESQNDEPISSENRSDEKGTGRRLFLTGAAIAAAGVVTAVGPARIAAAAGMTASSASGAASGVVAAPPGPKPPKQLTVNEKPISPLDPEFHYDRTPGADNTAAVQAAISKAMTAPGGEVSLPAGEIYVTALAVDYRNSPTQPVNGLPYGYAGPKITGAGMRQTKIIQIAGSTADIFTVCGQVDSNAGPANNNKATGVTIADLELTGTPGGGNGLYLRSLVNCEFRNIWMQKTGKSGIFRERATFVGGVNDEYSYANSFNKIKIVSPGGWGVQDSGIASIGGSMTNVEAISPGLGGFLLAPTNMTLLDCQAIGGTVGLRSVRNQTLRSVNSGLTLLNFRSEGSREGYEILVEAGISHMIVNPNFFPTSGAHCLGVGLGDENSDNYVRNLTVVGGYFGVISKFGDQKAMVLGPNSRNTRFVNPTIELGGGEAARTEESLISDGGYRTSFDLPGYTSMTPQGYTTQNRFADSIPTPAADQVNEGWEKNGSTWQKVAVFPDGRRVVIAS
ncbi:hypothetical protein [Agreia sp. Leaf210]|uniref:hypothetical protein n=1 Tax=Agreia sp. Leaf210 TaxID=1735682 RepID=UPI0006F5DF13|nr:hypothetical protein [Agreia sp. Leaf210]KQM60943.1 hypothetical protein ASE64_04775 [Agreia sp. Leaf210]